MATFLPKAKSLTWKNWNESGEPDSLCGRRYQRCSGARPKRHRHCDGWIKDAAIETADVVIQTDQPGKVATAIRIGKFTQYRMAEHCVISASNWLMILGAECSNHVEAVFADVGVAYWPFCNAVRILRTNKQDWYGCLFRHIEQRKIKPTAIRLLVLKAMMSLSEPFSLLDLENYLDTVDKSTETINLFLDHHLIHCINDGSGSLKYSVCGEDCNCSIEELHALYCQKCHRTFCLRNIPVPTVQRLPRNFTWKVSTTC